jgi:type IV pilus assembly protein PilB
LKDPLAADKRSTRHRILCDLLVRSGFLPADKTETVLQRQKETNQPLSVVLSKELAESPEGVAQAIAEATGYPYVNVSEITPHQEPMAAVTSKLAREYGILPLRLRNHVLTVATADPFDLEAENALSVALPGYTFRWQVAEESALLKAIEIYYGSTQLDFDSEDKSDEKSSITILDLPQDRYTLEQLRQLAYTRSASQVLDAIYSEAISQGASDIHIEPTSHDIQVRFRIDGLLRLAADLPKSIQAPLLSRAKLLADMDISESRKPQDGRSRLVKDQKRIDLRVSSLPTIHGEKLVIRILDPSSGIPTLKDLGMLPYDEERFSRLLKMPQGMILVTGPTGSGKSTTLYASLEQLKQVTSNIITVEDPVEREISGVNQVPVREVGGVTFASALRSILRQDPNVIMVGEIRDQETANIAFRAALTGHLVFSTLHTLDAPTAVIRCLDLGLEPYLVSSALTAVLAQRLVRRNCPNCTKRNARGEFESAGCAECDFTGFKGRIGVFELLILDDAFREVLTNGANADQLREQARLSGMKTLEEDAREKIGLGWIKRREVIELAPKDGGEGKEPKTLSETATPPVPEIPTERTEKASAPVPPTDSPYRKEKVLVADDDPIARELIRKTLQKNLYEVLLAEDGAAALESAFMHAPDIILTDIVMPELNGYELCSRIKSHPKTKTIPVIMLTSQDDLDSEVRGLEAGADDFIGKPIEPKRLIARLSVMLRRMEPRN